MNRTFHGATISGAILLFFFTLVVESRRAAGTPQKTQGDSTTRTKRVDELFNRNCARCHGADGRGDTPLGDLFNAPDFTDPEWWKKNNTSTKNLVAIVSRGKAGMPAFGKKLTKAQINLLVGKVRQFRQ